MINRVLRAFGMAHLLVVALVVVLAATPPSSRLYGDRLQVALPLLAWGCAATHRAAGEFALRFGAMFVTAHGSKAMLGDATINQRPNGRPEGFPSAHTAAATLGASSLVHDCIAGNPAVKALLVMSAAYVGGSRIKAGVHDIWQVLAGGLLGWGCDRALRRHTRVRRRVGAALTRAKTHIRAFLGHAATALYGSGRTTATAITTFCIVMFFAAVARPEVELSLYGGMQTAPHGTIRHSSPADE